MMLVFTKLHCLYATSDGSNWISECDLLPLGYRGYIILYIIYREVILHIVHTESAVFSDTEQNESCYH